MDNNKIEISPLGHTWVIDLDGTLCKHNGYLLDGHDTLLPGAEKFIADIPENDLIVLITSRTEEYAESTRDFLDRNGLRYDHIIFDAPFGERIIVNDAKPSGLRTSIAVNVTRDAFDMPEIDVNPDL